MRAARVSALCLMCLLLLSGCTSGGREPDELTVVRLAAADGDGAAVTITAFPAPLEGAEEEGEAHTGKGENATEACLALASDGGSFAFLGHTEHILMGEGLAENGLLPLLECAVLGEMRPDAYLWLVEGDTAAAWGQEAGGDKGAKTLSAYCTDSGTRRKVMAWTAAQSLNRLLRTGAVLVPVLPAGGGEPTGYAVLTENGVAGTLRGRAAEGAELLLGQTCHHTLTVQESVLEPVSVKTTAEPVWEDGTLAGVDVLCRITARRSGGSGARESTANEAEALEAWAQVRLTAAWEALSHWNVDGVELYRKTLAADPWRQQQVASQWPEALSDLRVTCRVDTQIDF